MSRAASPTGDSTLLSGHLFENPRLPVDRKISVMSLRRIEKHVRYKDGLLSFCQSPTCSA
nr:MAG TPA: hypothetical protein [Caudoviricetes sp.]